MLMKRVVAVNCVRRGLRQLSQNVSDEKLLFYVINTVIRDRVPNAFKLAIADLSNVVGNNKEWTNFDSFLLMAILLRLRLAGDSFVPDGRILRDTSFDPKYNIRYRPLLPAHYDEYINQTDKDVSEQASASLLRDYKIPYGTEPVTSMDFMVLMRYMMKLAHSVYQDDTSAALKYMTEPNRPVPKVLIPLQPTDPVSCVPSYLVTEDSSINALVIAIRGTWSWEDALINATMLPTPFLGGTAHRGMLHSARQLLASLEARGLRKMAAAAQEKGYNVLLVGHSLGAGVAAILASIMNEEGVPGMGRVHAYCFHCPSVMSPRAAERSGAYVTSLVNGDDIISRFSLQSTRNLALEIRGLDWMEELSLGSAGLHPAVGRWLSSMKQDALIGRLRRSIGVTETLAPDGDEALQRQQQGTNKELPLSAVEKESVRIRELTSAWKDLTSALEASLFQSSQIQAPARGEGIGEPKDLRSLFAQSIKTLPFVPGLTRRAAASPELEQQSRWQGANAADSSFSTPNASGSTSKEHEEEFYSALQSRLRSLPSWGEIFQTSESDKKNKTSELESAEAPKPLQGELNSKGQQLRSDMQMKMNTMQKNLKNDMRSKMDALQENMKRSVPTKKGASHQNVSNTLQKQGSQVGTTQSILQVNFQPEFEEVAALAEDTMKKSKDAPQAGNKVARESAPSSLKESLRDGIRGMTSLLGVQGRQAALEEALASANAAALRLAGSALLPLMRLEERSVAAVVGHIRSRLMADYISSAKERSLRRHATRLEQGIGRSPSTGVWGDDISRDPSDSWRRSDMGNNGKNDADDDGWGILKWISNSSPTSVQSAENSRTIKGKSSIQDVWLNDKQFSAEEEQARRALQVLAESVFLELLLRASSRLESMHKETLSGKFPTIFEKSTTPQPSSNEEVEKKRDAFDTVADVASGRTQVPDLAGVLQFSTEYLEGTNVTSPLLGSVLTGRPNEEEASSLSDGKNAASQYRVRSRNADLFVEQVRRGSLSDSISNDATTEGDNVPAVEDDYRTVLRALLMRYEELKGSLDMGLAADIVERWLRGRCGLPVLYGIKSELLLNSDEFDKDKSTLLIEKTAADRKQRETAIPNAGTSTTVSEITGTGIASPVRHLSSHSDSIVDVDSVVPPRSPSNRRYLTAPEPLLTVDDGSETEFTVPGRIFWIYYPPGRSRLVLGSETKEQRTAQEEDMKDAKRGASGKLSFVNSLKDNEVAAAGLSGDGVMVTSQGGPLSDLARKSTILSTPALANVISYLDGLVTASDVVSNVLNLLQSEDAQKKNAEKSLEKSSEKDTTSSGEVGEKRTSEANSLQSLLRSNRSLAHVMDLVLPGGKSEQSPSTSSDSPKLENSTQKLSDSTRHPFFGPFDSSEPFGLSPSKLRTSSAEHHSSLESPSFLPHDKISGISSLWPPPAASATTQPSFDVSSTLTVSNEKEKERKSNGILSTLLSVPSISLNSLGWKPLITPFREPVRPSDRTGHSITLFLSNLGWITSQPASTDASKTNTSRKTVQPVYVGPLVLEVLPRPGTNIDFSLKDVKGRPAGIQERIYSSKELAFTSCDPAMQSTIPHYVATASSGHKVGNAASDLQRSLLHSSGNKHVNDASSPPVRSPVLDAVAAAQFREWRDRFREVRLTDWSRRIESLQQEIISLENRRSGIIKEKAESGLSVPSAENMKNSLQRLWRNSSDVITNSLHFTPFHSSSYPTTDNKPSTLDVKSESSQEDQSGPKRWSNSKFSLRVPKKSHTHSSEKEDVSKHDSWGTRFQSIVHSAPSLEDVKAHSARESEISRLTGDIERLRKEKEDLEKKLRELKENIERETIVEKEAANAALPTALGGLGRGHYFSRIYFTKWMLADHSIATAELEMDVMLRFLKDLEAPIDHRNTLKES